ncbi:MAG: hypothetical protein P8X69_10910 [Maritimibacter sp.]
MGEMQLTKTRIQAGIWEGVLTGAAHVPELEVSYQAQVLDGFTLREDPEEDGRYLLQVPIPAELLSEGVQTFVIAENAAGSSIFAECLAEIIREGLHQIGKWATFAGA